MPNEIQYKDLSQFDLDPLNPRLGRSVQRQALDQETILKEMSSWALEELATSFMESGFWAHEAVLCIEDKNNTESKLVVIEGNRRIAALKMLKKANNGEHVSKRWQDIVKNWTIPESLFNFVPYILVKERSDVYSFLGFRHVTGIKEWAPPEKAQFITMLIDEQGMSYGEVMRRIGSKVDPVRRNYIAYSILLQAEELEGVDIDVIENKFSVLFLSLRNSQVQEFLGIADKFLVPPQEVRPPVPTSHIKNLKDFIKWLFGDNENMPIVRDSRQVEKFARILGSDDAVDYLRAVRSPNLDKAFVVAGGDISEMHELLTAAAYNMEQALSSLHHHKTDERLKTAVQRISDNCQQMKNIFGMD